MSNTYKLLIMKKVRFLLFSVLFSLIIVSSCKKDDPVVIDEELADFRIHGEAKGSTSYAPQLDAAYSTARQYAPELGLPGKAALMVHWLFSLRTWVIYRFIKP